MERVRRRCVEEGLEAALGRRQQLNRRQRKLDGAGEARLIALTCSQPPEGRASWTLRLLADQLVECEMVDSISTDGAPDSEKNELLAERMLVHPAPRQCRIRLRHVLEVYHRQPGERGPGVSGRTSKQEGDPAGPSAQPRSGRYLRL